MIMERKPGKIGKIGTQMDHIVLQTKLQMKILIRGMIGGVMALIIMEMV
jgi:hypothetical protein